jgi:tRNA-specific 2-thiouridylase
MRKRNRVLVAMSGGVDSSVAALLLKERGYEVVGATLNLWSYEGREEPYNGCCSLEVRTVAEQLGIEHHFVDEGEVFHREVIEPFVEDYLAGRTPSPCGRCNRLVRFPKLLELADALGCDYLATGHHARIRWEGRKPYLLRAKDPLKDQSYFLYGLTREQLEQLLFPVGHYLKDELREIARRHGLVSARRPESQDLCFLPQGDAQRFLKERANGELRPGKIVDLEGRVLGEHPGFAFFTVGQRRGLGISAGEKLYVVALDREQGRVIVGPEEALYSEGLIVEEVHFIHPDRLSNEERIEVKIRYRSRAVPATLQITGNSARMRVVFEEPQRAVTPGQLAVFYRGEKVLGGGTIAQALSRIAGCASVAGSTATG